MQVTSMTGFASVRGEAQGHEWLWEVRSVNGKTLDLRLRLPEWIDGLEPLVRKAVSAVAARGNISVSLRVKRGDQGQGIRVSEQGLAAAISALKQVETAAMHCGLTLTPLTSSELLNLRGVLETGPTEAEPTDDLRAILHDSLGEALTAFAQMRREEGAQMALVLQGQIAQIADLVEQAASAAQARSAASGQALDAALARVIGASAGAQIDPDRIAQELALLAVKSDITEEIDRLRAHITAAHALLQSAEPMGRKFEFLMQEFLREANTLCSKSGSSALTAIGLDLKHTIDQMREQILNVE